MKTFPILPALLLWLTLPAALPAQSFAAGKKHETSIGAVKVSIPLPDTFANMLDQEGPMKRIALATRPAEIELMGMYASAADLENASKNGGMLPFFIKASYPIAMKDKQFTEAELATGRGELERRQQDAFLKVGSPKFEALMREISEEQSKARNTKIRFTISDAAQFGIVASAPDHFTTMMLTNNSMAGPNGPVKWACLVTTTIAKVKERVLLLYTLNEFRSPDDIAAAKKFSEDWFNRIRAANLNPARKSPAIVKSEPAPERTAKEDPNMAETEGAVRDYIAGLRKEQADGHSLKKDDLDEVAQGLEIMAKFSRTLADKNATAKDIANATKFAWWIKYRTQFSAVYETEMARKAAGTR